MSETVKPPSDAFQIVVSGTTVTITSPGAQSSASGTVEDDGTFSATQFAGQTLDWTGSITGNTVEGRVDYMAVSSGFCHNSFTGTKTA